MDAVLIPIGTTEQHGPQCRSTPTASSPARWRPAQRRSASRRGSILVAPTLNMTLSWYHMQFPGSIRLQTTTFFQVFREVCDSLAQHGLENLVAVNGHGGKSRR